MRAVLINTTDVLGHHGCTLVNRQLDILARSAGIDIVARVPLHHDWSRIEYLEIGCVIVNGEGTLHSNSRGAHRIAQVPSWALRLNVPSYLINTIYQNNSTEIARNIQKFTHIWARDRKSVDALNSAGIKAEYVPDLTISASIAPRADNSGQFIFQDSTLEEVSQELLQLSKKLKIAYIPLTAAPTTHVIGKNLYRVTRFWLRKRFHFLLWSQLQRTRYKNTIPDLDDFLHYLKTNVAFIVTGRFHGVMIALALGIPFVALRSNSNKMEALLSELNMTGRLVSDIKDVELALKKPDMLTYSNAELEAIQIFRSNGVRTAHKMFLDIAEKKNFNGSFTNSS